VDVASILRPSNSATATRASGGGRRLDPAPQQLGDCNASLNGSVGMAPVASTLGTAGCLRVPVLWLLIRETVHAERAYQSPGC